MLRTQKNRARWVVIVLAALALMTFACGGGSGPTGPSTIPTPPPLVVRDGATDAVVSGANVSPAAPVAGSSVHIEAPGYLVRDQMFNGAPVYLWPQTLDYVSALVYGPLVPNQKLTRWTTGGFAIGLGALAGDAGVRATLQDAASEAQRVSGLSITLADSGPVTVEVAPDDPEFTANPQRRAYTLLTTQGNRCVSARMVFKSREQLTGEPPAGYRNNALHELGHVLGLGHSVLLSDVMASGIPTRTQARTYSGDETVSLRMIYRYRQPGNSAPDRDAGLSVSGGGTRAVMIVD